MGRYFLGNDGSIDGVLKLTASEIEMRDTEQLVKDIRKLLATGYMSGYDRFYAFIPEFTVGSKRYAVAQFSCDLQIFDRRSGVMADAFVTPYEDKAPSAESLLQTKFFSAEEFTSQLYKTDDTPKGNEVPQEDIEIDEKTLRVLVSNLLYNMGTKRAVAFTLDEKDVERFTAKAVSVYKKVLAYIPNELRRKVGFISRCDSNGAIPSAVKLCAFAPAAAATRINEMNVINVETGEGMRENSSVTPLVDYIFKDREYAVQDLYDMVEKPCLENGLEINLDRYLMYIKILDSDIETVCRSFNAASFLNEWINGDSKALDIFDYQREYISKIVGHEKTAVVQYLTDEIKKKKTPEFLLQYRKKVVEFLRKIGREDILNVDYVVKDAVSEGIKAAPDIESVYKMCKRLGQLDGGDYLDELVVKSRINELARSQPALDDILNNLEFLEKNNFDILKDEDKTSLLQLPMAVISTDAEMTAYLEKAGRRYSKYMDDTAICKKLASMAKKLAYVREIKAFLSEPAYTKYIKSGKGGLTTALTEVITASLQKAPLDDILDTIQNELNEWPELIDMNFVKKKIKKDLESTQIKITDNMSADACQESIAEFVGKYNSELCAAAVPKSDICEKISNAVLAFSLRPVSDDYEKQRNYYADICSLIQYVYVRYAGDFGANLLDQYIIKNAYSKILRNISSDDIVGHIAVSAAMSSAIMQSKTNCGHLFKNELSKYAEDVIKLVSKDSRAYRYTKNIGEIKVSTLKSEISGKFEKFKKNLNGVTKINKLINDKDFDEAKQITDKFIGKCKDSKYPFAETIRHLITKLGKIDEDFFPEIAAFVNKEKEKQKANNSGKDKNKNGKSKGKNGKSKGQKLDLSSLNKGNIVLIAAGAALIAAMITAGTIFGIKHFSEGKEPSTPAATDDPSGQRIEQTMDPQGETQTPADGGEGTPEIEAAPDGANDEIQQPSGEGAPAEGGYGDATLEVKPKNAPSHKDNNKFKGSNIQR